MIKTLFVDDSIVATRLAEKVYSDVCDLDCVSSLPEAFQHISSQQYDLFIIDYRLGDGNGLELVEKLRSLENYLKTPIILISSTMTTELAYEAIRMGVNQTFDKLVPPREIKKAIERQVELPHVVEVTLGELASDTLCWRKGDTHYEYSPELNKRVSGQSAEEARAHMHELLCGELSAHSEGPFLQDLHITNHRVRAGH